MTEDHGLAEFMAFTRALQDLAAAKKCKASELSDEIFNRNFDTFYAGRE